MPIVRDIIAQLNLLHPKEEVICIIVTARELQVQLASQHLYLAEPVTKLIQYYQQLTQDMVKELLSSSLSLAKSRQANLIDLAHWRAQKNTRFIHLTNESSPREGDQK